MSVMKHQSDVEEAKGPGALAFGSLRLPKAMSVMKHQSDVEEAKGAVPIGENVEEPDLDEVQVAISEEAIDMKTSISDVPSFLHSIDVKSIEVPAVYFEKEPILSHLVCFMWRLVTKGDWSCKGCQVRCATSPLVFRFVFLTYVLLVVKILIPILILEETKPSEPEATWAHLFAGAAGWAMVVAMVEEDILRDIWWLIVSFRMRGRMLRSEFKDVVCTAKELISNTVSLIYDIGCACVFAVCTWRLMRATNTIVDKAKDCAALSAILLVDEAVYEHIKFDVPGATKQYITPWHMCVNKADAQEIVSSADRIVCLFHWMFSLGLGVFACAYVAQGI